MDLPEPCVCQTTPPFLSCFILSNIAFTAKYCWYLHIFFFPASKIIKSFINSKNLSFSNNEIISLSCFVTCLPITVLFSNSFCLSTYCSFHVDQNLSGVPQVAYFVSFLLAAITICINLNN